MSSSHSIYNASVFTQQLILLIQDLEPLVHGRGRKESMDETYFGVYDQLLYARKIQPVEGNPPFSTSYPSPNGNCFAMYMVVSHVVLLTYVLPLYIHFFCFSILFGRDSEPRQIVTWILNVPNNRSSVDGHCHSNRSRDAESKHG
jgi:hypothetical protein